MREYREAVLAFYLPDHFKNITEFQKITELESKEINSLNEKCMNIWNDGFIATAGYQGIKKWESLLNIKPDSKLSLDERRAAVLTEWGRQLPYTECKLREQLTSMLGDDYELYILNKVYELKLVVIERPKPVVKNIQKMVQEMIPANLMANFFSKYRNKYMVLISERNSIHFCTAFYPRYNLPYQFLDNTWKLDDSELNGYNSGAVIAFYPMSHKFQDAVAIRARPEEQFKVYIAAKEKINVNTNVLKIRNGIKEKAQHAEKMTIQSTIVEKVDGPVRVMNKNVMDNNWRLGGERCLNGGLSIL